MSENFQPFRATTKIHLGGTHISENEVVEFDGTKLRRLDGSDLSLEYPSAFTGAINAGWVVKNGEEGSPYVPQPAGVEVRSAKADGTDREIVDFGMVHDEDQTVGSVVKTLSSPTKGDAKVVGKLKTSAKSEPVQVGVDDRRVVQEIEQGAKVDKAIATGDVDKAIAGEDLVDLLPNAVSSGQPEAGIFGEDATLSSGSSSTGGAEEGMVVATVTPGKIDWDMSPHWKVRAKRAIELYANDLASLQAVMAVEKRGVQKEILRQLYAE